MTTSSKGASPATAGPVSPVAGLALPSELRLRFDHADERRVTAQVRAWIESDVRKPGLHASDLLYPRISYWKTVDPQPLDDRLVWIFAVGRALHTIHNVACGGDGVDEGSEWSEDLGIWFSPDLITEDGGVVELKTTRSPYVARDAGDIEGYLFQLAIYMVAKQRTHGLLRVLYINHKDTDGSTTPRPVTIRVEWTESGLAEYREAILRVSAGITAATAAPADAEPWRALPLCPKWMCGRGKCVWFEKCQPEGRWKPPRRTRGKA